MNLKIIKRRSGTSLIVQEPGKQEFLVHIMLDSRITQKFHDKNNHRNSPEISDRMKAVQVILGFMVWEINTVGKRRNIDLNKEGYS